MIIAFSKMQALGNDFVVIDATKTPFQLSAIEIAKIADRHYGVGCDQLLVVTASTQEGVDFGYRIFNADGTEVAQCGNGARCVGLFVREKRLSDKDSIVLATSAARLTVSRADNNDYEVSMTVPKFAPTEIPYLPTEVLPEGFVLSGVVNVGNPHAVMIQQEPVSMPFLEAMGQSLNQHAAFPARVNVECVHVLSRSEIDLVVYERGVGITQACGSGACAAVVVAHQQGLVDNAVRVRQPGGVLTVFYDGANDLRLCGEAVLVFDGVLTAIFK